MMLNDRWGAETSPSGFELQTVTAINETVPGIVDYAAQIQSAGESIIQAIARAQSTLAMSDFQREMLAIQLQRAQQGLPPLQTTGYSGGVAGISTQTLLLIALAIAALYLLPSRR